MNMSRFIKVTRLFLALVLLGLAACNLGGASAPTPTQDQNLVYTEIWVTVAAGQTETALVIPPTETATLAPQESPTLEPSHTPLISDTPQAGVPTATTAALVTRPPSQQPCDNMSLVEDVNYPDGTEVPPGGAIFKTWRFKNLGPCTWERDYRLVFGWQSGGTDWDLVPPVAFDKVVLPGETIDLTIRLEVPTKVGDYGAWYRLQNNKGYNFGEVFAVYIKVVKP
jgi:hypothetical protein